MFKGFGVVVVVVVVVVRLVERPGIGYGSCVGPPANRTSSGMLVTF
jgi:hypothetical protein